MVWGGLGKESELEKRLPGLTCTVDLFHLEPCDCTTHTCDDHFSFAVERGWSAYSQDLSLDLESPDAASIASQLEPFSCSQVPGLEVRLSRLVLTQVPGSELGASRLPSKHLLY